jgi:hypothetical protein
MWMDEESKELKQRISEMSDEELLDMVEVDFADYRQQALDFAKSELMARGISFEIETAQPETQTQERDPRALRCAVCGEPMRPGILFAEKELTVIFTDNDEERFVEIFTCKGCGRVELRVDYETDVQRS